MTSPRLIILALFIAGCQGWKLPKITQGRRAQYYVQKSEGAYQYGYDTDDGLFEEQHAKEVKGQFGAAGRRTAYTAGAAGFVASTHTDADDERYGVQDYARPHAAPVRFAAQLELNTLPKPVSDTPEVAAAKRQFQKNFRAAAARDDGTYVYTASHPAARPATHIRHATLQELNTLPKPVSDTPAVAAAKRQFQRDFSTAAAAADAAPDVHIVTGDDDGFSGSFRQPVVSAFKSGRRTQAGPVVTLDSQGRVQDTAEVKAAKQSFQAAFNAAAAAADSAPHVSIIHSDDDGSRTSFSTTHSRHFAPTTTVSSGPVVTLDSQGRVQDTAEVKAAKQSFKAAFNTAAAAAAASPDVNVLSGDDDGSSGIYSGPVVSAGPVMTLDSQGRVQDTAEVKAAKQSFKAAFDAAASAAANAPDTSIITGSVRRPTTLYTAPAIGGHSREAEIASFQSTSNSDGSYQFSYETSDSSRHETADAANNVNGNFEFVADDGQRRRVDYKAGAEIGFIASGAHVPVSVADTAEVAAAKASFKKSSSAAAARGEDSYVYAAPQPAARPATQIRHATQQELNTFPKPVSDTPEVAAAKRQFQRDFNAAAAVAAAAPDVNIITGGDNGSNVVFSGPVAHAGPIVALDSQGRVQDTAEVKAAKQSFKAAFRAAAAAADAAPDVNIITSGDDGDRGTFSSPAVTSSLSGRFAPAATVPAGPAVTFDSQGRVQDTAEVRAAKKSFQAAFNTAAAAAGAAPDVNIFTTSTPVRSGSPRTGFLRNVPGAHSVSLSSDDDFTRYSSPGVTLDTHGRVQETAEVKAAKKSFQAAFNVAAAAAKASPDTGIVINGDDDVSVTFRAPSTRGAKSGRRVTVTSGVRRGPVVTLDSQGRVQDTATVKAAKQSFQAAFNTAAAAAEAAPDTGVITAPVGNKRVQSQSRYSGVSHHSRTAHRGRVVTFNLDDDHKHGYYYD